MGKVKELESEIPAFNPDTHRWDWELKQVKEVNKTELKKLQAIKQRYNQRMINNRLLYEN